MAGTDEASMVESEGSCDSEIGSCDSEIGNKRLKSSEEEEEDRFSALPDFLIHRILSLLPATDLVNTLFLSKWWKFQWTRVPVLEFVPIDGMSPDKFYDFIDETLILHDCSNIEKFVIDLKCMPTDDQFPDLDSWIHFAVGKDVKELIVNFNDNYDVQHYYLPQFLFNNSSLIKLKLSTCSFVPIGNVNWGSLKSLSLYWCQVQDKKIENAISGSPLLEYLELCNCDMFYGLVIASKSLKALILDGVCAGCSVIEISCPNLERLRISGAVWFTSLKLRNLPSSVYATLDFYFDEVLMDEEDMSHDDLINLVDQTLQQVEHVEKLEIGHWLMDILSSTKEGGDFIGGLTDSVIHRFISSFPSIKDAFERDLHETWQLKWSDVPIFNFVSNEKFVIDSKDIPLTYLDPRLSLWIRIATRKDVKELILDCDVTRVSGIEYLLPQFLFYNSSLVKMKICGSNFIPTEKVNWESLKSLELEHSELGNQATIEHVLSGSPLLECLKLRSYGFQEALVIASEHLKTFLLDDFGKNCHLLEISCPNLESLIMGVNVGSTRLKLMNLPSSLDAALYLYVLESDDISPDDCMNLVEGTMKQILHVEQLDIRLSTLRSQKCSNCS